MPRDIAEAARARSGPSGLSASMSAAVARQIERDNLDELVQVAEAEHGPVTDEEIQAPARSAPPSAPRADRAGTHSACPAHPPTLREADSGRDEG